MWSLNVILFLCYPSFGKEEILSNIDKISRRELSKRIEKYFSSRVREEEKDDKKKREVLPYTVTGLAYAIGLQKREELYMFKDEERALLINRALLKIEEYAEERLFSKEGFSGIRLYLSTNFERWRDKEGDAEEITLTGDVEKWAE